MQYIKLAKANIDISKISFGCQRFEEPKNHEKNADMLLYAFNKGINFFDTAVTYAQGECELIIGKAIKEFKKTGKPFYISSRCNDGAENDFRRKLKRSLKNLNLNSIDFFTSFWGVKSYLDWKVAKRYGGLNVLLKA